MKELHLICNAHLDPVWQWDWNEGKTAAIATFYSAVKLANDYDYIFCHNEALLYEWIEKYDPKLFKEIKRLVMVGKWHIMGGWYVQPDCNIPSGEGFLRQIKTGLSYFLDKFGVRPNVAVNFDTFGHSQGLVQILKKCGYNGYLFCRPMPEFLQLPDMLFNWVGFDGSTIKAVRFEDENIYCSGLGSAVEEIKRKMKPWKEKDIAIALWGVGNHGGGASRKDLEDIKDLKKEQAKLGVHIIHSTPEEYFSNVTPSVRFDSALQPCFVKCYSSDSRIKSKYAELEDKLIMTEKICTIASMHGYNYDRNAFKEAEKILSSIQFHDILSGTSIREGEKSALQKANYALEILDEQFATAFLCLSLNYEKGIDGEYPIFVFNPHPYEIDEAFECEILALKPIISDTEGYEAIIRKNGEEVPFQIIKESSCIAFDRRKRFLIKSKLNPMSLTRFNIALIKGKKFILDKKEQTEFNFAKNQTALFSEESGCLKSLKVNDNEYLSGDAFQPIIFDDNPDPWGWYLNKVGKNYKKIPVSTAIRVVERGKLVTTLESVYNTGKSEICISYRVYNDLPYIDIKINVCWNDNGKGLKLEIPVRDVDRFIGQTAFGTQKFSQEKEECSGRFCAVGKEKLLSVFKKGNYGCSVENGKLYLTLFNGSVYCAHPIEDYPIIDEKRFNYYMEKGQHEFSFRLEVCDEVDLERKATEFSQQPYSLNVYPHGEGIKVEGSPLYISDNNIVLSSFQKVGKNFYNIVLVNNYSNGKECFVNFKGEEILLKFGKYEVKRLVFDDVSLKESNDLLF